MDMNIIKLNVHSNQECFDKAVRYLKGMPRQATTVPGGSCVYETEDGKLNCIVGAMLVLDTPDKHSWARSIRSGVKDILRGGRKVEGGGSRYAIDQNGVASDLLSALQGVHDSGNHWDVRGFVGWWRLEQVAHSWGLKTDVLDAERTDAVSV